MNKYHDVELVSIVAATVLSGTSRLVFPIGDEEATDLAEGAVDLAWAIVRTAAERYADAVAHGTQAIAKASPGLKIITREQ